MNISENEEDQMQIQNSLSERRFTEVDLKVVVNPLVDIRVPVSLNTILKGLKEQGEERFSEAKIYKVSIPEHAMERAKEQGK